MGLLDDEELLRRPAFGVFPQMQPRRRFQDPVGAANVPLDVTRGRLAGLLGLLPDALNFMGRSPMPTEMFGDTQYEPAPQMPYGSEYYLKNLPLAPTSRIGEVAGQAGAFVPLNPMPAARAVAAGARALGPTAVGMGERYLQRQGLMPAVVPETPGLLGSIEKPQAPVSELGFYSAAEQTALNIPRKSGTGESFLNDLMKGQDVKKDELSWMGLDDYLKGKPNVTRQEVQDFIANNRVDVKEVTLGEMGGVQARQIAVDDITETLKAGGMFDDDAKYALRSWQEAAPGSRMESQNRVLLEEKLIYAGENRTVADFLDSGSAQTNSTKYSSYQLPGGENYREILLTLPEKAPAMYPNFETYFKAKYSDYADSSNPAYAMAQRDAKRNWDAMGGKIEIDDFSGNRVGLSTGNYTSSHFDQPNILAHMRVNDRVDADGKKMLLIEEIQSDWHQAGREKGYASKETKRIKGIVEEQPSDYGFQTDYKVVWEDGTFSGGYGSKEIAEEVAAKGKTNAKEGVPDAPFKDTWHQLALKRALKYAADNGYDRVGLTTGRQQAERYNLAKQVDYIDYVREGPDKYRMAIVGKDGQGVNLPKDIFSEVELKSYLGNDVAKRIVNGEGQRGGGRMTLRGPDLQVGGEGMKKYYDEIYPAFLAKQGKKYNAKTGETRIKIGKDVTESGISAPGIGMEFPSKTIPANQETIRYIDISPEMRGGVKKGQPLFTAAPIGGIGLGAGTQDNEMPDAVRQYMANPTLGLLQDEEERKKLGGLLFR